jgi:hypothetical protein
VDEGERLCPNDPENCGDHAPVCTGLIAGTPGTLSEPCNIVRGTAFQDKCEGCGYTLSEYNAAQDAAQGGGGSTESENGGSKVVVSTAVVLCALCGFVIC